VTRVVAAAVALTSCILLAACSGGNDTSAPRTRHRTLVVNEAPTDLCVAVAGTLAEQVAGLSNRPSIPAKEGMAFVFADADTRSFTMRDTFIPLSIVWVGPENKVLGSTSLTPDDKTPKESPGPIFMAVELSPQDWSPIAATARTMSLGEACEGTVTAGRPGQAPTEF
jgi:uncharacterized membrane protein (UPF0127 family)